MAAATTTTTNLWIPRRLVARVARRARRFEVVVSAARLNNFSRGRPFSEILPLVVSVRTSDRSIVPRRRFDIRSDESSGGRVGEER